MTQNGQKVTKNDRAEGFEAPTRVQELHFGKAEVEERQERDVAAARHAIGRLEGEVLRWQASGHRPVREALGQMTPVTPAANEEAS